MPSLIENSTRSFVLIAIGDEGFAMEMASGVAETSTKLTEALEVLLTKRRRRCGSCFGGHWCFKSNRQGKRIGHAVLVPEPPAPRFNPQAPEIPDNQPALVLPFIAPPSSPASFLQSEPHSASVSPAGPLSFSVLSANSPPMGTSSIFAVGPYSHETQLVSPPVFSTFTTEPSTASFTPPPEPVHLTTPSSPEVPFAKLLTSSLNSSCAKNELYEFNSYQLYPGSPIGNLISPSSVSGTSSPFPDVEFPMPPVCSLSVFSIGEPPKMPGLSSRDGGSSSSNSLQYGPRTHGGAPESEMQHRVSFELTAEEFAQCIAKKPPVVPKEPVASSRLRLDEGSPAPGTSWMSNGAETSSRVCVDETYHDLPSERPCSSGASPKEFKFDNREHMPKEPSVGSDWWANEKVAGGVVDQSGGESQKKWVTFSPLIQPEFKPNRRGDSGFLV